MEQMKIILYIAQSLDGYTLSVDGSLDWLPKEFGANHSMFYAKCFEEIDAFNKGINSSEHINTELGSHYYSRQPIKYHLCKKNITTTKYLATKKEIAEFIQRFSPQDKKDLWIIGGANFAKVWINKDLIDEYIITIIPVILGNGSNLFSHKQNTMSLELLNTIHESGCVQLRYVKKQA